MDCTLTVGPEFFDSIGRTEAEVVMAVTNPEGRILLMTKAFYLEDVYRIPTGKLKNSEDPDAALRRELMEETGFELNEHRPLGVIGYTFHCGEDSRAFTSHVYLIPAQGEPQSQDEGEQIAGFRWVPVSDLPAIANQLRSLPDSWTDWGRFRAIAHDFVGRVLGLEVWRWI